MRCHRLPIALALLAAIAAAPAAAVEVDDPGDAVGADCSVPASGTCTLRQAILDANAAMGGSVELPAGMLVQLRQGPLPIDPGASGNVTITVLGGPSPFDTAIDGDGNGRVFAVLTGTLDLAGVTVRNGDAGGGIGGGLAVSADAALLLTDAVVTGNAAADGGGISVANGGAAELLRVVVSGNQVIDVASDGGGIYNAGELVLRSVTVAGNFGTVEQGGGVFNLHPGTLASEDSAILGNVADVEGGGLWSNSNGSLPASSVAACDTATGAVCLVDTAISGNSAPLGAGYHNDAGGFELIRGRIATNFATDNGGGLNVDAGSGSLLQVEVSGNEVTGNAGANSGGGIRFASAGTLDVDQSVIESNRAFTAAGILATGGTLNLLASRVLDNAADQSGGGVQLVGSAQALIEDTAIEGNQAAVTQSNGDGAGLWTGRPTTVRRSTIAGNTIVLATNQAFGGGIFAFGGALAIEDSTISGNSAGLGGGIGTNGSGTLSLTNATLVFNTSTVSTGIVGENLHHNASYPTTIRNSIIARAPGADDGNCNGLALTAPASGFNLRENGEPSCGFNSTDDETFDPADLGPLQDNGGPVKTHALVGGPGVDAADDSVCSALDNRGYVRSQLMGFPVDCDMGSYEIEALPEPGLQAGIALGIALLAAMSWLRGARGEAPRSERRSSAIAAEASTTR